MDTPKDGCADDSPGADVKGTLSMEREWLPPPGLEVEAAPLHGGALRVPPGLLLGGCTSSTRKRTARRRMIREKKMHKLLAA